MIRRQGERNAQVKSRKVASRLAPARCDEDGTPTHNFRKLKAGAHSSAGQDTWDASETHRQRDALRTIADSMA